MTLSLTESQRLLGLQECGDLQSSSFAIIQRWTTGKIPTAQHLALWTIVWNTWTTSAMCCTLRMMVVPHNAMADAEGDSKNMPSERRNMSPGIWSLRFPSRCYGKWSDKHIPGAPAGPDIEVHHEQVQKLVQVDALEILCNTLLYSVILLNTLQHSVALCNTL